MRQRAGRQRQWRIFRQQRQGCSHRAAQAVRRVVVVLGAQLNQNAIGGAAAELGAILAKQLTCAPPEPVAAGQRLLGQRGAERPFEGGRPAVAPAAAAGLPRSQGFQAAALRICAHDVAHGSLGYLARLGGLALSHSFHQNRMQQLVAP